MKQLTIFNNGKFQKYSPGELKAFIPGVIPGRGVFETMAVYEGMVFAWQPHWVRLQKGLRLMRVILPYSQKIIESRMQETLRRNQLKSARIRLMVSEETRKRNVHIIAMPRHKPSAKKYRQGFHLGISPYLRNKGRCTHIKSIDYKMLHEVHNYAKRQGYDDGLLFNKKGYCVESAYANIFIVHKGKIVSPPVSSGCLNGITRNIVQVIADDLDISVTIANIRRRKLLKADEVFITNSLLEIMPVKAIDRQKIGTGRPGAITKILGRAYTQLVEAFKRKHST